MKKLSVILGFVGLSLLFAPKVSAQNFFEEETTIKDGLYYENETGVKTPMPLLNVREADVMWKKTIWREIDFTQKMNQGFYYPTVPHRNMKNLYTILEEALSDPTSGVVAYSVEGNSKTTGELVDPITWEDILNSTSEDYTYEAEDEYGNITVKIGKRQVSSTEVKRCQIKEEWYFDKQRSELLVKIIAICPVKVKKEDGKNVLSRLFWVPYDDNLRKILVNSPFVSRTNSAARLSYDDVFLRRVFDSYIIREDNVFDRSIQEYAKGIEVLRESERIKQSIIDFEQNLWEY